MITIRLLLLIIAAVCFLLSAAQVPSRRVNLVSLGLLAWVLTYIIPLL